MRATRSDTAPVSRQHVAGDSGSASQSCGVGPYPTQNVSLNESMSALSPHCEEALRTAPLGKNLRQCFSLEEDTAFLNHGSYGTAPNPVLASQAHFVTRMEVNPQRFIKRELPMLRKRAAQELAEFVGSDSSDLVFVTNATTGVNSVLRSLDLQDGDEVIGLSILYPAINNTIRFICYYTQEVVEFRLIDVDLPLDSYDQLVNRVLTAINSKTRLAVFDHITSTTGLLLPVERLIKACHSREVPVLIDGAHAAGQIPLNLRDLNADFYVGNCYKWLFTSKSCGFLYVKPQYQVSWALSWRYVPCTDSFLGDV